MSKYNSSSAGDTDSRTDTRPWWRVLNRKAAEAAARRDRDVEELSWTELTGFRRDLLKAISELEGRDATVPTGQSIKRALEPAYDEPINHGRLYQNLGTLAERGLIEKRPVDGRTNAYRLTPRAEDLLERAVKQLADATHMTVVRSTS